MKKFILSSFLFMGMLLFASCSRAINKQAASADMDQTGKV